MAQVRSGSRVRPERLAVPGQAPRLLAVPAAIAVLVLVLPPAAIVAGVDWAGAWQEIAAPAVLAAMGTSAVTSLIAAAVCMVLGAPLALAIVRAPRALAAVVRTVAVAALVVPPVVSGAGLRALLSPDSLAGGWMRGLGADVLSSPAGVVLAQIAVSLPVAVLVSEFALRTAGRGAEFAAAGLGAGRWRVLWRVTLPAALPGLVAAGLLSFARAIGEFAATVLAGAGVGTAPLAVFSASAAASQEGLAAALSLLFLLLAVLVAAALRAWRTGADR